MIVGVCHRTSLTFIGGLQASYDNYVRPAVDKVERVKNEPPAEFAIYGLARRQDPYIRIRNICRCRGSSKTEFADDRRICIFGQD